MACSLDFTPAFLQHKSPAAARRDSSKIPRPHAAAFPQPPPPQWGDFTPRRGGRGATTSSPHQPAARPGSASVRRETHAPIRLEYVPPITPRRDYVRVRPKSSRPFHTSISSPRPTSAARPQSARPQSARGPGGVCTVGGGTLGSDRTFLAVKPGQGEAIMTGPFCEYDALRQQPAGAHLDDDSVVQGLISMGMISSRARSATPSVVRASLSRPQSARRDRPGAAEGGRKGRLPGESDFRGNQTSGGITISPEDIDWAGGVEWYGSKSHVPAKANDQQQQHHHHHQQQQQHTAVSSSSSSAQILILRGETPPEQAHLGAAALGESGRPGSAPVVRVSGTKQLVKRPGTAALAKQERGIELAERLHYRMSKLEGEAAVVPVIEVPLRTAPSPVKACTLLEDMLVAMRQQRAVPTRPSAGYEQAYTRSVPQDGQRWVPRQRPTSSLSTANRGMWSVEGGDAARGGSPGDASGLTACITKVRPSSAPSKQPSQGSRRLLSQVDYSRYIRCGREAIAREFNSGGTERYLRRLAHETVTSSGLPSPEPPMREDVRPGGNTEHAIKSYTARATTSMVCIPSSESGGSANRADQPVGQSGDDESWAGEEGMVRAITPTVRVAFVSPAHSRPASRAGGQTPNGSV